jgi:uncharacterized protein YidB (DUF937 family)
MGLLDSVIGALGQSQGVGGVSGGGQAALISAVIGMLGQGSGQGGLGGLGGLVAKMQQSGLGDVAASWVGTGQNQPIQPDQLGQVLGGDMLGQLGQQLGMNQGDLLGQLSQMLPQVVDKLTPQGQIPQGDIAGMLGGLLGGNSGGQQGGQGGAGGLGDLAGMLGGLLNKR